MNRRSVATLAVAAVCAATAGVAGWRLGWIGQVSAPSTPAAPAGGEPETWSADVVRTFSANGATTTSTSHFARSGDRTRIEWTEGNRRMAVVVRPDLGVNWLVDLSANSYVETPIGSGGAPTGKGEPDPLTAQQVEAALSAGSPSDGFAVRREKVGVETVHGQSCVVYRSRLESLDGTSSQATVWEASELAGLAIRSEIRSSSGSFVRTELQQFRAETDPGVFELPAGAVQDRRTP